MANCTEIELDDIFSFSVDSLEFGGFDPLSLSFIILQKSYYHINVSVKYQAMMLEV